MEPKVWADMFHLGLPVIEKIARPVVVYGFLVCGLRLAGKRELAQLNPFDLVVLLTLSNTVQNAIIGDDNTVLGGLIGATTLLLVNYFVVRFLYRHARLDRVFEGEADLLMDHGKVKSRRLAAEMITRNELEAAARKQGFGSLNDVESATLEPGGGISFSAKRPMPEEARHLELVAKIDALMNEVAALRSERKPATDHS